MLDIWKIQFSIGHKASETPKIDYKATLYDSYRVSLMFTRSLHLLGLSKH